MNRPPLIPRRCLLLAGLVCLLSLALPAAAATLPHHRISLSFELKEGVVNGTSRVALPAGTPLNLDCGPLEITGLVLEQEGMTPRLLKMSGSNALALPLAPGEQALTLSWRLRPPVDDATDNRIGTDAIILAGFWHPIADRDLLFSLEAALPRDFEAISEADTLTTTMVSTGKRVTFSLAQPLRSLHFAAGPYVVQSKQLDEVTVATYLFREDAALASAYLTKAANLIERYRQLIGPYPFRRFAIVENRLPTGYGLPGFTLLGQAVLRLPFVMANSLGHEILHSWFGNSVQVSEAGGNWSEGLTTYLADQRFAEDAGRGPVFRKGQLVRYRAYVHPENTMPLNTFQSGGDHQPVTRMLRAVGYDKAAMVMHMLRRHVGEEAFLAGLRSFYRQMRGQRAGWQDLEAAFAHNTPKELGPFFRQWLERTDLPDLAIEKVKVDQRQGRSLLAFDLVQRTPEPYRLDIPIRITTLGGEVTKTLTTASARERVSLELDSLPTTLVVDGEYDLMRRLDPAEIPPTWSQFLGAGEKTAIAPPDAQRPDYQPLIDAFRQAGCRIAVPSEVGNKDLARGSWLFLGDSPLRRALFADPPKNPEGLTLDVRRSPLNPEEVMVLVDSASKEESGKAVAKLDHYGAFSRLRFKGGKNLEQTVTASTSGIVLPLIDKPQGIPMQARHDFDRIVDDLAPTRVLYIGETHTDYGNHLLQLQLIQALQARGKKLAISLEMFPRSSQQALDSYIRGTIDEREFIKASNYFEVWGFDYRLYRDILAYARAQRIPLVGLNLDKAITRQVFATGSTDGLTPAQQTQMAGTRDLDIPGYQQRLHAVHSRHDASHGGGFTGFLQAQAIWDETMAESVIKVLERYPGHLVIVLAGNGHVVKDNGIPPRVSRRVGGMAQRVVTVAGDTDLSEQQVDYLMFAAAMELTPAGKLGVILKEEGGQEKAGRVRIDTISPHGLAGQAGLRQGDRILAVDGQPVTTIADIKISLLDKKAGEVVSVHIGRGREQLTVPVELSAPETRTPLPPEHPK